MDNNGQHQPRGATQVPRLIKPPAHSLWYAYVRDHVGALLGTDNMGDLVLNLLTGSFAPATYDNHGTGMRRFTVFCDEGGITPLWSTAADISLHGSPDQGQSRRAASSRTS
jgi:hypothetical protein